MQLPEMISTCMTKHETIYVELSRERPRKNEEQLQGGQELLSHLQLALFNKIFNSDIIHLMCPKGLRKAWRVNLHNLQPDHVQLHPCGRLQGVQAEVRLRVHDACDYCQYRRQCWKCLVQQR